MSGFWKADAIASGLELATAANLRVRDAEESLAITQRLVAERNELENSNAANFAEKHALKAALAKLQPNHPLLTSQSLVERIQAAGQHALTVNSSWDDVKAVGAQFKY